MEDMFDVLIVGAGLVGSSLACALSGRGLKLALVEAVPLRSSSPPSYDERNLALALGSVRALEVLGVWPKISSRSPIRRVHVSSRGQFGVARIDAAAHRVDALGYVLPARELGEALHKRVAELDDVELICPASVVAVDADADQFRSVELDTGQTLQARLLVAADGSSSILRALLGIAVSRSDYGHHALVGNLSPERDHQGGAWERFTRDGPVAMLPLTGGRCGYIWTVGSDRVEALMALDDEAFLQHLQQHFGYRLGRFVRLGRRLNYPLQRCVAEQLSAPRALLVGNAAQTVHPVAAQGFNLGLRDALCLAELVQGMAGDPGRSELLAAYCDWRTPDREATLNFSDGLLRAFSNPFAPVRWIRALGLLAMDRLPALQSPLAQAGMGYRGRSPRLLRGVSQ